MFDEDHINVTLSGCTTKNMVVQFKTGLLVSCRRRPTPSHVIRTILRELRTKPSRQGNDRGQDDRSRTRREGGGQDRDFDFRLHKSKGQHLLTNPRVLDDIVRRSGVRPEDTVLEIGPGTGNLTLRLLEAACKVVAVEIDGRMVEVLRRRVAGCGFEDRLGVICGDVLQAELPRFDLVVANIPYQISSPLVTKLVYGPYSFRSSTLLLQKEFARRLLAGPGDSQFNRLAVNVKLVADVELVMDVSRRDFLPCPKVDSSVVIIRPKADIPNVNLDEWRAFTRTCFSNKNKTLGATFKQKKKVVQLLRLSKLSGSSNERGAGNDKYESASGSENDDEIENDVDHSCSCPCSEVDANLFKEKVVQVLRDHGFEDKRPSKLSIEELLKLLSLFNQAGVFFS